LGEPLSALGHKEKAAVAASVRAEYNKLVSLQSATSVVKVARANPKRWQNDFGELIAADAKRVLAIVEMALR